MKANKSFIVKLDKQEKENIALAKNTMMSAIKNLEYHKDLKQFINKLYTGVQALEMLQNEVIDLGVYSEDLDSQFHDYYDTVGKV